MKNTSNNIKQAKNYQIAQSRLYVRSVTLDAPSVRNLKRFGHGNLSLGVRKAAASRRFAKYHRLSEAAFGVIDAYDGGLDLGPAIDALVKTLIADSRPDRCS